MNDRMHLFLLLSYLSIGFSFYGRSQRWFSSQKIVWMKSYIDSISFHVSDLPASLLFYTNSFGMKILQQNSQSASIAFPEAIQDGIKLELVEKKNIRKGDAFIGFGIQRPDAIVCFSKAAAFGGKITMPFDEYAYAASLIPDEDEMKSTPVSYGKVEDPDGYTIELIEGNREDPLCKVMLSVEDLDDCVKFYTESLHMKLLRRRANIFSKPKSASIISHVGYGSESKGGYIELVYRYATEKLNVGDVLSEVTIVCNGISGSNIDGSDGGDDVIHLDLVRASTPTVNVIKDEKSSFLIKDPTGYKIRLK